MEKRDPRILLVDDEEPVRQVLGVALRPAGYTMYQVGNGGEALRSFQLVRPDWVLLDLDLPDIDGKEVIRRLPGARLHAHYRDFGPRRGSRKDLLS
ncbi:MAG: response regulator [Edaphobacter sp.]